MISLLTLTVLVQALFVSAAPVAEQSSSTCSHAPSLGSHNESAVNVHASHEFPTLAAMLAGNQAWADNEDLIYPGFIRNLSARAQRPKAMALLCSDSRVPIEVVTNQPGGTYFVDRNIANQYSSSFKDTGAESALAYAVEHLEVKHLLVIGHYGCGGVGAAIATPAMEDLNNIGSQKIADWVRPIRKLFLSSDRPEIVAYRNSTQGQVVPAPVYGDPVTRPAFRALVEENILSQVRQIARDETIQAMWQEKHQIFVHGWVYDLDNGRLKNLNTTIGPETSPSLYALTSLSAH